MGAKTPLRWLARTWGRPPDEDAALACIYTNLFVLPGIGSLMGGRRVGWAQAVLALVGFGLTLPFLFDFFARWFRAGAFPLGLGGWLLWAVLGLGLFGVSWAWSFATGVALLRSAARAARSRGGVHPLP